MNLKQNKKPTEKVFKKTLRKFGNFKKNFSCQDYAISIQPPGKRLLLEISTLGVFTVTEDGEKVPFNGQSTEKVTGKTLIDGYLYSNKWFTGIDILYSNGKDVRAYSLKCRYKYLVNICKTIPNCENIKYSIGNIYAKVKKLIKSEKPVMFIPIHANYINTRSFVYKSLRHQTISFKVSKNPFTTYNLYDISTDTGIFNGTKEYPFEGTIVLSAEERKNFLNNNTILFKWFQGRFVPVSISSQISSLKEAEEKWEIINTYTDNDILMYLKTTKVFKKTN